MAEAAAVYITNRFSQQVVAAPVAGLGMEDRLGAESAVPANPASVIPMI